MEINKKVIHLLILACLLFLSIIGYLTYFQIFVAGDIIDNPYNKRQWAREDSTLRGIIYDRNSLVLADSDLVEGKPIRKYPYNQLYSHIIGYNFKQYGRAGLEAYYNQNLMNLNPDGTVAKIWEELSGNIIQGNNLILTIDHELQKTAEKLLGDKLGSIVAMNAKTGEILAMVSKPDFNPNSLVEDWDVLVNDERSPLLNRALSGLYAPGSAYKTIIAAGVLENRNIIDDNYNCEGSILIDGYTLSDYNGKGHGPVDLTESLVVSCNTNFARMTVDLGEEKVKDLSNRFFMGRKIEGDLPIKQSRFPHEEKIGPTQLAAIGIGQGKILVTPIHMALVASTFANDGIMPKPYIVKEIQNPKGRVLERKTGTGTRIVSHEIGQEVKAMMIEAVQRGTGNRASIPGVVVGGKTGTAQNESDKDHAWFIGFASNDKAHVGVAVILEKEGQSGGVVAAPIAGQILKEALRRSGDI